MGGFLVLVAVFIGGFYTTYALGGWSLHLKSRWGWLIFASGLGVGTTGFIVSSIGYQAANCTVCVPFLGYFWEELGVFVFAWGAVLATRGLFLGIQSMSKHPSSSERPAEQALPGQQAQSV
jgi:hypothetical protein